MIVGWYEDSRGFRYGFCWQIESGNPAVTTTQPVTIEMQKPGVIQTYATGISANNSNVGGFYDNTEPYPREWHGFRAAYDPIQPTNLYPLDVPYSLLTTVFGINNNRQIVGQTKLRIDAPAYGFWSDLKFNYCCLFGVPGASLDFHGRVLPLRAHANLAKSACFLLVPLMIAMT